MAGCLSLAVFTVILHFATAAYPCDELADDSYYVLPHSYNCSLYWECYDGAPTLLTCPVGLYFNAKLESCDFASSSGCVPKSPYCQGVAQDYFADPSDCTRYIECYNGVAYIMNCPNGLWFNSISKGCVQKDASDCVDNTWTTPHPICQGVLPGRLVLKPYEGSCTLYWKCSGSNMTVESCPTGLYFNESKSACDLKDLVNCQNSTGVTTPYPVEPPTTQISTDPRCSGTGLSYWGHPYNCQMYVECYNDKAYELLCPGGMSFSQEENQCVDSYYTDCGKNTTTTTQRTTTEKSPDWSPEPDCSAGGSDGWLFPFPGNCTKYYECYGGMKYELDCPNGLWWNQKELACDYPYQTSCIS